MPTALNLTFRASPLPTGFVGSPQDFLDAIVARLAADQPNSISFFATGSVAPSSDVGPWMNNGQTWYVWDTSTGSYVPEPLSDTQVRYIASSTAPSAAKYTLWIVLDGTGKATAIKYYSGGAWKDIYEDQFSALNTAFAAASLAYPAIVQPTSDQAILVDGNYYKGLFNNVILDSNSCYDATNSKYVAPIAGIYEVVCNTQIDNVDADATGLEIGLVIYKNDYPFTGQPKSGANAVSPSGARWYPQVSGLIQMAANDSVSVWLEAGDSGSTNHVNLSNNSQFYVQLVQAI